MTENLLLYGFYHLRNNSALLTKTSLDLDENICSPAELGMFFAYNRHDANIVFVDPASSKDPSREVSLL